MNKNEWSGSRYEGEYLEGWFHGKGKYFYPNGVIYEGDFFKGQFHGEGVLIYPNGVTPIKHKVSHLLKWFFKLTKG